MRLFKTIFDIVTLPVEIAKDVITLNQGGFTRKRIDEIDDDIENKHN